MAVSNEQECVTFQSGRDLAVLYGFVGSAYDFSSRGVANHCDSLLRTLGRKTLVLMRQEHTSEVREIPGGLAHGVHFLERCDAVVCSRSHPSIVLGVRTADCVPILIEGEQSIAAVHAGWRGIASGVIENAIEMLRHRDGASSRWRAVVGPCAGVESYEVGEEVVAAIGSRAIVRKREGRFMLDLAGTAGAILERAGIGAGVVGVNTMVDPRYHSYRKAGPGGGHNLSFICSGVC